MASSGEAEKNEVVDKNIRLQDLKKQINGVFKHLKGGSSNSAEKKVSKPKNLDQKNSEPQEEMKEEKEVLVTPPASSQGLKPHADKVNTDEDKSTTAKSKKFVKQKKRGAPETMDDFVA